MTPQDTLILLHIPLSAQAATQGPVPSKALGDQLDGQGQGQGLGQGQEQGQGHGRAGAGTGAGAGAGARQGGGRGRDNGRGRDSLPQGPVTPGSQWPRHLLDDVSVLGVHLGNGPQVPKDAEDLVHLPRHRSARAPPRGSG